MELIAVAAVSENGVIGDEGELPWPSVPADRRQYRERVKGHPVILGRLTFESMLEELPGAVQIVLTSDPDRSYDVETVRLVDAVSDAIDHARDVGLDRAYVLGGGRTFEELFPHLDRLYISRIPGRYAGDTTFPTIDPQEWQLDEEREEEGFTLETWVRREGH